jgi:hypothetical protein
MPISPFILMMQCRCRRAISFCDAMNAARPRVTFDARR